MTAAGAAGLPADDGAAAAAAETDMSKRQAMAMLAGFSATSALGLSVPSRAAPGAASLPIAPPIFRDVGAGLAAVAPGQLFAVGGGGKVYASVYERVGERAVERAQYATAAAFAQDAASLLLSYRAPFPGARQRSFADKLSEQPLSVVDFGVTQANGGTDNRAAFNRAIAAANASRKRLYIPAGTYAVAGTLDALTGPGMAGDAAGGTAIHHSTRGSCIVTRGSYTQLSDITVVNTSGAGKGVADAACFHLVNCAYGRFTGLYAAHDLDGYAGIMLEQRYDGSPEDAAFIAHLGCWYNHFLGCSANYATPGLARGYGIRFRVAPGAVAVADPPGQGKGTYSGQCSYNIIDLANIEQRAEGLRIERGVCNQIRGGQFLGSDVQVRLIDGAANLFVGTRHNQWRRAAFVEDGGSGDNVILYPSLFQTAPQPWSLGRLAANSVAVRSDQRGSWTPHLMFGGVPAATTRAVGSFVNSGGIVVVNWDIRLAAAPSGGLMEIGDLPFPAVNDPTRGIAICDLFILDHGQQPRAPSGRSGHGYCASRTITAMADHQQDLTAAHFDCGAIILGKMTFFTDWT